MDRALRMAGHRLRQLPALEAVVSLDRRAARRAARLSRAEGSQPDSAALGCRVAQRSERADMARRGAAAAADDARAACNPVARFSGELLGAWRMRRARAFADLGVRAD